MVDYRRILNLHFKIDLKPNKYTYSLHRLREARKKNPLIKYFKGTIISFSELTTMEARRGELIGR